MTSFHDFRPGGEQRSPCTPPVAHGSVPSKDPSVVCGARGRDGSCPRASRRMATPAEDLHAFEVIL